MRDPTDILQVSSKLRQSTNRNKKHSHVRGVGALGTGFLQETRSLEPQDPR